jgi:bud site selection protein 20
MGRPVARKKQHKGDRPLKEKYRTRRRTKDHDQIHADLDPVQAKALLSQAVDLDVTGNAQHYCIHCAKYFINEQALGKHFAGKPHKRRIKALQTEPYTQAEAERAAGMGSYVAPKTGLDIRTQDVVTKMESVE